MAIGDATSDHAPLQIGQFESTAELMDQWLTWSFLEGGGGGSGSESYELAFYMLAQHTDLDCWTKRKKRGYLSRQLSEAGGATGSVLFEGAQGMLLDEWRGFHPHTTWSTVGPGAVEAVLRDAGVQAPVRHFGILRTYPTRHGAGPFPTWDPALDLLPEPHNASDGWQGAFRRGHPDSVLLRYATDAAGPLHGLLLSHADALAGPVGLRWCSSYEAPATPGGDALLCERAGGQPGGRITRLLTGEGLPHQEALTVLLKKAKPVYEEGPGGCGSPGEFIERLQAVAACPVRLVSQGPTHRDVMPPAESP